MKQPTLRLCSLLPIAAALVACGAPDPVVVGRVSSSSLSRALTAEGESGGAGETRKIEIAVNGFPREIEVAKDGSFALDGIAPGDVNISIQREGFAASIAIQEVEPAELIEIEVGGEGTELTIRVVRREPAEQEAEVIDAEEGEAIVLRGNKGRYYLPAGEITNDIVIEGNNVTLVGVTSGGCDESSSTVLSGRLSVRGNKFTLVNVVMKSGVEIQGNKAQIFGACGAGSVIAQLDD